MKRYVVLALICASSLCVRAQVVDTTACDILKDPQSFNGKMVRLKATVSASFDQFVIKGDGCHQTVNDIWLAYPDGSKGKAGPAALVQMQPAKNFAGKVEAVNRTPVTLDASKDFKQFDSALAAPAKTGGMCLGCARQQVTATLVGRLDGTKAGLRRNSAGQIIEIRGFGNLNAYSARLVLQSVSDVAPKEIDYSKFAAATKSDSLQDSGSDPMATNRKAIAAFGASSAPGTQLAMAVNAYGKDGDKNTGVVIAFNGLNETGARFEAQAAGDSPDGVIFNCLFNKSSLKGDALARAYVHAGKHVDDLRHPEAGHDSLILFELEQRAWVTTTLGAIATGQKTLTLPGGDLLWNAAWPASDREKNVGDTLTDFLKNEELLEN